MGRTFGGGLHLPSCSNSTPWEARVESCPPPHNRHRTQAQPVPPRECETGRAVAAPPVPYNIKVCLRLGPALPRHLGRQGQPTEAKAEERGPQAIAPGQVPRTDLLRLRGHMQSSGSSVLKLRQVEDKRVVIYTSGISTASESVCW